jgi:hypothetical protein
MKDLAAAIPEYLQRILRDGEPVLSLSPDQLMGTEPVSQEQRKRTFPGVQSGMFDLYWSKLHALVLSNPSLVKALRSLYGPNYRYQPNRLRLSMPLTGMKESMHMDSNGFPDTATMVSLIVAISEGRPFVYYKGTADPAYREYFFKKYRKHLKKDVNYVSIEKFLDEEDKADLAARRCVYTTTTPGEIIFFPAHLIHEVAPNSTKKCT